MSKPFLAQWRPILLSLILFAVNVYICRELFSIDFLDNLSSNDGAFITLARFFQQHGTGNAWFPWFNGGMPIEDVYQPLLPALAALAAKLTSWPIARAFHFVVALFYCLGPVTLFWFVREWSKSLYIAFIAGLAYCLTSPAAHLIPILHIPSSGLWGGLRLFNLIHYAEDAHNVSLTLLPLALLFLHRAVVYRNARNIVATIVLCASGVLANAFGAVDLAIGGLCLVLALNRGLTILVSVGIVAWLWISPMLPPSLIDLIRQDQWGPHGSYHSGAHAWLPTLAVLAVFALLWLAVRRYLSPLERFSLFFAYWMCIIPLSYFLLNVTLAPQANRYQVEMEMALCLGFACLCAHIPWRTPLIAILVLLGIWQTAMLRHYARTLLRPVDVAKTIEYKVDTWIDRNLPGQRTLISGDSEYLFNVFSDNPQMSAGHEFSAPNWEQRVAVYTIYTGTNAGDRDAEYSLLWLQAFGNQAIYVPGEKSRESYHPIAHPHKFDGVLPVLWHDEDDTIFAVPQRSRSLAHVIPKEAVVAREPIHGLDVDPVRPYVAALEDPSLPLAEMRWEGTSRALIQAPMKPGQVLSVQVTWAPGWRASVDGRKIPLRKDAIGLMVLEPGCNGPCDIRLDYVVTTEGWICRILSGLVTLGMIGFLFRPVTGSSSVLKRTP
jgi:hypothetical protein